MATMKNIKEKIAKARELCPGMSNDFYILTDYMAEVTNDELEPMGIVLLAICVRDDIIKGRCGFAFKKDFPKELIERKGFVNDEIKWIPQLVDAIADEEFAEEVRAAWSVTFGFVPPKRICTGEIKTDIQYPGYIEAAVNWWSNAIISPKFDNGMPMPESLEFLVGSMKEFSKEEIKIFKEALSEGIMKEFDDCYGCYISVDYHPCSVLAEAGDKIGVQDYPCKTSMKITKNEVTVSAGYQNSTKIIWKVEE